MQFSDLITRAMQVRQQYASLEQSRHGRAWNTEEIALGFVGDVGDLAKLVMAKAGIRDIPDAQTKIAHELADCLWSVIVLAQLNEVDLESAFLQTMEELEQHNAKQSPTS